jgi:hypothetical protein
MSKRETYTRKVRCAKCGNAGVVKLEENETPPHHDGRFNTRIVSMPSGFVAGKPKGNPSDPEPTVMCQKCKIEVESL